MNIMKSPIMSRKDSYIYKISKEIHKGTKITSNPLEKLVDHYVEHKINMRNDKGCDPQSHLCSTRDPLSQSFLLLYFLWFLLRSISLSPSFAWHFIEKRAKSCRPICPGELNSPRQAKLAQVSFLLSAKGTHSPRWPIARSDKLDTYVWRNLISLGELVASLGEWMSETLEKWPFSLPFNLVSGSNK